MASLRKRLKKLTKRAKRLPGVAVLEKGRKKLAKRIKESPEASFALAAAATAFGGPAGATLAGAAFGAPPASSASFDVANEPESAASLGLEPAAETGKKGSAATTVVVVVAVIVAAIAARRKKGS